MSRVWSSSLLQLDLWTFIPSSKMLSPYKVAPITTAKMKIRPTFIAKNPSTWTKS